MRQFQPHASVRGSQIDHGPTCHYCGAELRFLKLASGKRLPVEREPSDDAGYVVVLGGIANVLSASDAAPLREEGYSLFTIHDCVEGRERRRRAPARPAADVVPLPTRTAADQLALDAEAIVPTPPADLADRRARRARRRYFGGRR